MIFCGILSIMFRDMDPPGPPGGVLEERWSSPGILLALLGQDAMRRLRDALDAHDLKPRQHYLLGLLHDYGATGQRELGEAMGVDPSVLVNLLNPLEAGGLVSRERDPADRRRHVVTLTAAGRRRFDNATRAQREAEDALFAALDDDQRRQLEAVLGAMRHNLSSGQDDACSPPRNP